MSSHLQVKNNHLYFQGRIYDCAIGKGGFSDNKREGDGCTPLGVFALRGCLYRADRLSLPHTGLTTKIIGENDGWCDDPKSTQYNCPVTVPYHFSHERLWRDDGVYDIIVPLGYNDDPVVPGRGSAIFMHIAREGYVPTEGCVALAREDLLQLLPHLDAKTCIEISQT